MQFGEVHAIAQTILNEVLIDFWTTNNPAGFYRLLVGQAFQCFLNDKKKKSFKNIIDTK